MKSQSERKGATDEALALKNVNAPKGGTHTEVVGSERLTNPFSDNLKQEDIERAIIEVEGVMDIWLNRRGGKLDRSDICDLFNHLRFMIGLKSIKRGGVRTK